LFQNEAAGKAVSMETRLIFGKARAPGGDKRLIVWPEMMLQATRNDQSGNPPIKRNTP